jgi:hypothetical protein
VTDSVQATAALISDLPKRREHLMEKLGRFNISFVLQGDALRIDGFAEKKPAVLLLEPEGVVGTVDQLRIFVNDLERVSPDTKIIVSADWGSRDPFWRFCQERRIRVVSPSMEYIQLIKEMRAPKMGEGQVLHESRFHRLDCPTNDLHGLSRGRRF